MMLRSSSSSTTSSRSSPSSSPSSPTSTTCNSSRWCSSPRSDPFTDPSPTHDPRSQPPASSSPSPPSSTSHHPTGKRTRKENREKMKSTKKIGPDYSCAIVTRKYFSPANFSPPRETDPNFRQNSVFGLFLGLARHVTKFFCARYLCDFSIPTRGYL